MTVTVLRNYVKKYYKTDPKLARYTFNEYKKKGGKSTYATITGSSKSKPRSKTPINRDPTLNEYKQMIKRDFKNGNMDLAYNNYKQYSRDGGRSSFESIVGSKKFVTKRTKHGYQIKKKWF